MLDINEVYTKLNGRPESSPKMTIESICNECGISEQQNSNISMKLCQTMIRIVNKLIVVQKQIKSKSNEQS
jgi:hypothetical protein